MIKKQRSLKNPPLKEALIDVRVEYESDLSVDALDKAYSKLKAELPKKSIRAAFSFSVSPQGSSQKNEGVHGYVLTDNTKNRVLQITKEGITFSQIDNYTSWEKFEPQFHKYLGIVNQTVPIKIINRIGVRYINKIQIPAEDKTLINNYFTISPNFKNIETIGQYFMRVVAPQKNGNFTRVLTQGINPKDISVDSVGVVLDIDIFHESKIRPNDSKKIKSLLAEARDLKNDLFFSSITAKTEKILNA